MARGSVIQDIRSLGSIANWGREVLRLTSKPYALIQYSDHRRVISTDRSLELLIHDCFVSAKERPDIYG